MKIIKERLRYLQDIIEVKNVEYLRTPVSEYITRMRLARELENLNDLRKLNEAILHRNIAMCGGEKTLQ